MKNSPTKMMPKFCDCRFLGQIFVLGIVVLSSNGCATSGPMKFSGSTIRHVNDSVARSVERGTAIINVRWTPDDDSKRDHETLSEHTSDFTFLFLNNASDSIDGSMPPVYKPVIWMGSAISGAVYGTVGHIFAYPGKARQLPEGHQPGSIFMRDIHAHCGVPKTLHNGRGDLNRRQMNLELRLLNEGLIQQEGRFRKFYFAITVHARLGDMARGETVADMLIREISAPRKMSYWKEFSEEQWMTLVNDMELKLGARLKTELNDIIGIPSTPTQVHVASDE